MGKKSFVLAAFYGTTFSLFLFGLLVNILQNCLGSFWNGWPERDYIFEPAYFQCILWALLLSGLFFLYQDICRNRSFCMVLRTVLFVCFLFFAGVLLWDALTQNGITVIGEQAVSRKAEIAALRSKTIFSGRGEEYVLTGLTGRRLESQENRLYFVFRNWDTNSQLPVLSYCFGRWLILPYTVLSLLWSWSALHSCAYADRRFFFSLCAVLFGMQLWGPVLDYAGILTWTMTSVVFSTADFSAWTTIWLPPVLGMTYCLKE